MYTSNNFCYHIFKRGIIHLVITASCDCCCSVCDKSCCNPEPVANREVSHQLSTQLKYCAVGYQFWHLLNLVFTLPIDCCTLFQTYKPSPQGLLFNNSGSLLFNFWLNVILMLLMQYFHQHICHLYMLMLPVE